MASRRILSDDEVCSLLNQEDGNDVDEHQESDSEIEDHMSEDDVQSDFEDEYIDNEAEDESNYVPEDEDFSQPVSSASPGSSELDHRIIVPEGRVIRGKNRHCWSTAKGRSHGRTSAHQYNSPNRDYMKKLSTQLTTPWMTQRLEAPTLPRHVRSNIENILPKPTAQAPMDEEEEPPAKKRRNCSYCTSKKKRMSKMSCAKCKKPVCGEHKIEVCQDCINTKY